MSQTELDDVFLQQAISESLEIEQTLIEQVIRESIESEHKRKTENDFKKQEETPKEIEDVKFDPCNPPKPGMVIRTFIKNGNVTREWINKDEI